MIKQLKAGNSEVVGFICVGVVIVIVVEYMSIGACEVTGVVVIFKRWG